MNMEDNLKYKKVWLGEVQKDGRTILDHINAIVKHTGFVPKNAFMEVESYEKIPTKDLDKTESS